jgi:hypothetical protein
MRANAISAREPRRVPRPPRSAPTGKPSALLFLTGAAVAEIWFSSPRVARAQGMDPATADVPVTMDDFQQATQPYGSWLDTPEYGRVWRPDQEVVGDDFEPYLTNGRWISADDGWSFESAWVWGWATFHYGRWVYDAGATRWLWCPDLVWGPAWVQWRTVADTVAWVPLAPRTVTIDPRVYVPLWIAVETRSFLHPDLARHRIPASPRVLAGRSAPPALPPRSGPPAPLHRGPPRPTIAALRPVPPPPRGAPSARGKPPAGH